MIVESGARRHRLIPTCSPACTATICARRSSRAGLDPDNLPEGDPSKMNFGSGGDQEAKAWRDIWGCGQGIGAVKAVHPVAELVARFEREYLDAKRSLCG